MLQYGNNKFIVHNRVRSFLDEHPNFIFPQWAQARTTDTRWQHKSKISEKLGRCGRLNMLPPYLKFGIGIEFSAVQWRLFPLWVSVVRGKRCVVIVKQPRTRLFQKKWDVYSNFVVFLQFCEKEAAWRFKYEFKMNVCSNGFYADIWSQRQVQQYKSCLKSFL